MHSLPSTPLGLDLDAYALLHPIDSTVPCLPIMLYGSELWLLTNTELNIFEHTHRKILRTIQGLKLPTRCPTTALQSLIGSRSIQSFIAKRQVIFMNSIISMQSSDLPKQVFEVRNANPNARESLLLGKTSLTNSASPPSNCYSNHHIKRNSGNAQSSASLISKLTYPCNISARITATLSLKTTSTSLPSGPPSHPSLDNIPGEIAPHLPDLDTDPVRFTEVMLGLEWIKDTLTQSFIINFLTQIKNYRNLIISQLN